MGAFPAATSATPAAPSRNWASFDESVSPFSQAPGLAAKVTLFIEGEAQWPHIARYCDSIAAIPPIARYFLSHPGKPPTKCDTLPWCLLLHRHISAIPHFATYRAILVRYPRKTSTKEFCDTIAESIARYEKYRCWAS